jgi:flagellar FliL protein
MAEASPSGGAGEKKEEKKGERKKGNPIVLIGIIAGVLVALTGASLFVIMKLNAPAAADSVEGGAHDGDHGKDGGGKKRGGGHGGAKFEVKDLILNPSDTGSTRYVKISIVFETSDPKLVHELEGMDYRVRDLLISLIGRRTAGELSNADVREELRAQILDELNASIADGGLTEMFFTDFIIQ